MSKITDQRIGEVRKIISIASNFPHHYKHKVLGIGMIGELICCNQMNWDHSDNHNNSGFDALDENLREIQIKTFVLGNKTKMLPAFNPDAKKNEKVKDIAIVVLENNLTLNKILISSVQNYKSKLVEVEARRSQNSNSKERTKRYDMRIDEFESIKELKKYP